VIGAGVEIPNAGGGLNQAMAVEPVEYHTGETVFVVMECHVSKIRFDPVKDTNALRRIHTLVATTATLADKALVGDLLEQQRVKIEQARGVERLDFDPADEVEIVIGDDGEPA